MRNGQWLKSSHVRVSSLTASRSWPTPRPVFPTNSNILTSEDAISFPAVVPHSRTRWEATFDVARYVDQSVFRFTREPTLYKHSI